MDISIWLELRNKELKKAIELKEKGESLIWVSADYCKDINEYIKEKTETILEITEKYKKVG
jgi:hypothetical protein